MTRDVTLFVASTGGHLSQLVQLAPRIEPNPDRRVWITFDTPQSRSMLRGQKVHFIAFMAPRQWGVLVRNLVPAIRLFRRYKPDRVFSTGSGVALSFLPIARLFGTAPSYVESAARTEGPSITGKILVKIPGLTTYSQYRRWAGGPWRFGYSVFDDYRKSGVEQRPSSSGPPRVFVQVGTLDFPFERLVKRISEELPPDAEVTWQLGSTSAPAGLPGRHFAYAPASELADIVRTSTVVVSHAGVGSALMALNNGVSPILVPRRAEYGEHIDDHQMEIAEELSERDIASYVEVDQIDSNLLRGDHRISRPGGTR